MIRVIDIGMGRQRSSSDGRRRGLVASLLSDAGHWQRASRFTSHLLLFGNPDNLLELGHARVNLTLEVIFDLARGVG